MEARARHESIAAELGAELTAGADGGLLYRGELAGEAFELRVPAEQPSQFELEVRGAPRWFSASFRRTSRKDALHKRLFGERRRTGDERFDRDVFVVSYAERRALRKLLEDGEARRASRALLERGLRVDIALEDVEARSSGDLELTAALVRELVPHLTALKLATQRALPDKEPEAEALSSTPAWLRTPPRSLAAYERAWTTAADLLWKGLYGSIILHVLWFPQDARGWLAFLVLTPLLAIPLVARERFEGHDRFGFDESPRTPLSQLPGKAAGLLFDVLLYSVVVAPLTAWLTFGLNALGAAAPVRHATEVVALHDRAFVEVRSWRPGEATTVVVPRCFFWPRFDVGDRVVVASHVGLFGWEYNGRIARDSAPRTPSTASAPRR